MLRTIGEYKRKSLAWGVLGSCGLVTLVTLAFGQIDTERRLDDGVVFQSSEQLVFQIGKEHDVAIAGREKDRSGFSLAVGDINSDGQIDLFIGAPEASLEGAFRAGVALGLLGPVDGSLSSVSDATIAISFKGSDLSAGIGSGLVVADLNDDGQADLVVSSADMAVDDNRKRSGIIFVALGPIDAGSIDLAERADFRILGASRNDSAGKGLAAGDLNNDGSVDLAIGSPGGHELTKGGVDIIFGPFDGSEIDLRDGSDAILVGANGGDAAGTTIAIGDVNSDSIDDLVVNSRNADPDGVNNAGETYIVFGPIGPGTVDLVTAADVTISGRDREEFSGSGLAIGDLSGDGVNELVIGSMAAAASGRVGAGKVFVLNGPLQAGTIDLHEAATVVIEGERAIDRLGASVAVVDINDDGRSDLIVGASFADPGGIDTAGVTYIMYGNIFDRESTPLESALPRILFGVAALLVVIGGGSVTVLRLRRIRRRARPF
jgi:hypothetical protein